MNLIAILTIFIILILIIWGIIEYRKLVIIPFNEEEQKILKLLKDNIEGSTSTAKIGEDFQYIIITTIIKGLTFKYYKSFRFGGESVSLYLTNPYFIKTDEDRIFISSRLEKYILEILKPYSDKIISKEKERLDRINLREQQIKKNRLQKVLEDIEIK